MTERAPLEPSDALSREQRSTAGPSFSADAALSALRRWAEAMAELALQAGLNHAQLDELIRVAMVGVAAGRSKNVSQISVATGLHRKEVMRLQEILQVQSDGELPAAKKRPWASQLVLKWADWVSREPHLGVLPLALESPNQPCFAKLSKSVTTDVHPRAVLQELLRLGLVTESDGRVSLLVSQFVPKGSADDALGVLTENVADHLKTGLSNIASDVAVARGLGSPDKVLEQAIWAEGISYADVRRVNATATEAWAHAYRLLYKQLLDTPESAEPGDRMRVRIGMYVAADPMPLKPTDVSAAGVPPPSQGASPLVDPARPPASAPQGRTRKPRKRS